MPRRGLYFLERDVLSTLRRTKWPPPASKVLVAVSGGRDSIALLRILNALRSKLAWQLCVLHFNHGLRPECPEEAAWVAQQTRALDVPFYVRKASNLAIKAKTPLNPSGKGPRPGLQAAARTWRIHEYHLMAQTLGATGVALAHHQDDQIETLLFQWQRGVHLSTWQGVAAQNGIFFRPLLHISRANITNYLQQLQQPWLEDPSNATLSYARNRLRHRTIPQLDSLLGKVWRKRLLQTAQQANSLNAWVEQALQAATNPQKATRQTPFTKTDRSTLNTQQNTLCVQPIKATRQTPFTKTDRSTLNTQQNTLCVQPILALPPFLQSVVIHRWIQHHTQRTWGHKQMQNTLNLLQQNKLHWTLDGPGSILQRQNARLSIHST